MDPDSTASDAGTAPAPGTPTAPGTPAAPDDGAAAAPAAGEPTPSARAARRQQPPPVPQLVTELRELVVTYVKQQTLAPLQQLGRYVGFGIGGSLLLGFGVVFLALAGLRALQTETGTTFTDDWSWVPYVIMIFVLMVGAAIVWLLRTARRVEREVQ
jgi:hypothetical protein